MQQSPYGAWASPITVEMVAESDGWPGALGAVGGELWWTEPRPAEGGRRALIRRREDDTTESVLAPPWNPRNRVHEYGGRPWAGAMREDGPLVVFTNFADQRLYRFEPDGGGEPVPLTPEPPVPAGLRFCEPVIVERFGEVWAVMEEFTGERPTDLRRVLAAVPLDGSAAADRSRIRELTDGSYRFLTGPKLSPGEESVGYIAWNHPQMPWDGTDLRIAEINPAGELWVDRRIAGGPGISIAQVEIGGNEGAAGIYYSSDKTGWWNLYWHDWYDNSSGTLVKAEEEFAGPMWTLGSRWFLPIPRPGVHNAFAVIHGKGESRLSLYGDGTQERRPVEGPWTDWLGGLCVIGDKVYGLAASPASGYELVEVDSRTGEGRVIANAHHDKVDPAYYPVPEHRTFEGPGGREIHAHVYPPRNPGFEGPEGERPPYVVWVHGGPTSSVRAVLDMELAYFTSRGIGVVEVNYGGSTGYGREYRERLRERWGEVDVEDCAAVARALAAEGTADPARLAIRGGSAGGWTAAASLTSEATQGVYACAVVKYPILDLSGWTGNGTHDFESQYVYSLVGPPEVLEERSIERSPVHHAERIEVPFLLLQGLEDAICPPEQAEKLLRAVEGRGVPHAYRTYAGEQHGFRQASTIVDSVLAEHALYAQVFAFPGPDFTLELQS
ncbi:prolyl oligopeptidase family serine peptidase [Glycomyces luteolus]|uniref:Prolyl oligopeptidase family serine peptidase n=2 Tax=Glycomyces luteolus TaxID=2670330 RepID=A0A9X3P8K6_9ACTN|nr:prolyl oligopeptidase family serine peptidase [Glycomyces luteolus]MDA1359641.1 prolyl oligopeptidase family serine peptidase [Glycomyces luteolus]